MLPGERGTPSRRRTVIAALCVHCALWWALAVVLWRTGRGSWEEALAAPLAPLLLSLESDLGFLVLVLAGAGILVVSIARSLHRPRSHTIGRAHLTLALWWVASLFTA